MNIKTPKTIALSKPHGIDVRLQAMQKQLSANISWLEKVFGRAVAQYQGEENLRVPKVPIGNGEYFSVMPNDSLQAFSFFFPRNPATPQESDQPWEKTVYSSQAVDLIVWANLGRIEKGNLGLSEQLKEEIMAQLQKMSFAVVENIYSDDVREVYEGWAIDIAQRDLLVYPYYAMRFNLTVTYLNPC